MRIEYHKNFVKTFRKLPQKIKSKFNERLRLFAQNSSDPLLGNHSVDHAYPNWRSINVTGDYRALFEMKNQSTVIFMKIGTHSELYK